MNIFLARQAIYNREFKVVAYELLFRNSEINRFDGSVNADEATVKLISNCSSIGFNEITDNKKAYINFTKKLLLNKTAKFLSKDKIIIEILENINPSSKIIATMIELKEEGYIMALDDVDTKSKYLEFGRLITIYKIDFMKTTQVEREQLIKNIVAINPMAKILAEKVETEKDFNEIINNKDYVYYQGYYFSRPIIISGKDIIIRNSTCFQIMTELIKGNFDVNKIENIIKSDVAISYKLFKLLNSASFSFDNEINSIKQGIMILGKKELNKWITVVAMSEMQSENTDEMAISNIIRGRFCEILANKVNPSLQSQCFMAGLFSNLDKYMQRSMQDIVMEMPIHEDLKLALITRNNEIGHILGLTEAYENMQIETIDTYSKLLNVNKGVLVDIYFESLEWANKMLGKFFEESTQDSFDIF